MHNHTPDNAEMRAILAAHEAAEQATSDWLVSQGARVSQDCIGCTYQDDTHCLVCVQIGRVAPVESL